MEVLNANMQQKILSSSRMVKEVFKDDMAPK